jgi:hypothetical protein
VGYQTNITKPLGSHMSAVTARNDGYQHLDDFQGDIPRVISEHSIAEAQIPVLICSLRLASSIYCRPSAASSVHTCSLLPSTIAVIIKCLMLANLVFFVKILERGPSDKAFVCLGAPADITEETCILCAYHCSTSGSIEWQEDGR